jgi:cofilin
VNDESVLKFRELQSKRLHRFITFKMDDKFKEIVVDKVGDRGASYDDFATTLPENDCRYAIYDFDFVTAEDVQKSRIFYILWYFLMLLFLSPLWTTPAAELFYSYEMLCVCIARSPSSSKVKSKMLYASSNQKFKSGLNGIQVELQATDSSEVGLDVFKERAH